MKNAWIAVGLLGVVSGCFAGGRGRPGAGPGEVAGSGEPAPFTATCVRRVDCAQEVADCRARHETQCDLCYAGCISAGTCDLCISACSTTSCACGASDGFCREWSYEFQLPETRDETHYAACRRLWDQAAECGSELDPAAVCDRFARIERSEMAAAYDCFAAGDVCAPSDACDPTPDEAFADEVCDQIACTSEQWTAYAKAAGWLRDDTKDVARRCLDEDYRTGVPKACVEAWLRFVNGR